MAPVYSAADMQTDEHFVARRIFEEIDHPVAGPLRYPTKPFRLHGAKQLADRPAPTLGQHQIDVMAELAAMSKSRDASRSVSRAESTRANTPAARLPLVGIRVLELAEGWAGAMDGIAGYGALRHYPDRGPDTVNYSTHTDVVTGMTNAVALLIAIHQRARTGRGQQVEVSGVEASLHHIPEALMDYAINRRVRGAAGNDHPLMAPHGVYPCLGEDRWIAISVYRDTHWDALRNLMENPDWTRNDRFRNREGRRDGRVEIDRRLTEWTRTQDSTLLMERLQKRCVPAAAVHDAADHARDPHWILRGVHQSTLLEGYGTYPLPTSPWILDGERLGVRMPPPRLGQHDDEIYSRLLGLSESEIAELRREQILGNEPLAHDL